MNDFDKYGYAVIHEAARDKYVAPAALKKILSLLAAKGADLNLSSKYGSTPLMAAASESNLAAIDGLLSLAAVPMSAATTALIDRFLALKVDINARNIDGKTPLFHACESDNDPDLVKYLAKKGADPSMADLDGFTVLGYAKSKAYKSLVAYLTSLKIPEASGVWPVGNASAACKAVPNADLASIKAAPASEFESGTARTAEGVPATPLHLAAESGNGDVVAALIKAEASPLSRAIAGGSPVQQIIPGSGINPDWGNACISMAVSSPMAVVRTVSPEKWRSPSLNACAVLGRTDILE
jgi:ankyrin repeat protein